MGSIDTKEKLRECIGVLKGIGATYLKLNELQHSDSFVSFEEMMGVKLHSPFSNGCQHEIDLEPDMRIMLKRSCFWVEKSVAPSCMDLIKLLVQRIIKPQASCTVLYENGDLSNGWRKQRALLW